MSSITWLAIVAHCGCPHHPAPAPTTAGLTVRVTAADRHLEALLIETAQGAVGEVLAWGDYRGAVEVVVIDGHLTDTADDDPEGLAGYATIRIKSPRWWLDDPTTPELELVPESDLTGVIQGSFAEVLRHELAHVMVMQLACQQPINCTNEVKMPSWFLEGMAVYISGIAAPSILSLEQLREYPKVNHQIFRSGPNVWPAYSVTYHLFAFLLKEVGRDQIRQLLSEIHAGATFPEAFERITATAPEAFVERWYREELRLENLAIN